MGPETQKLLASHLRESSSSEQGYRSCLGVTAWETLFPPERLEAACARALAFKAYSYKDVESILKKGVGSTSLGGLFPSRSPPLLEHENLRGKNITSERGIRRYGPGEENGL